MRYIRSSWREQRVCRNLRQPRSRAIAAPHQRSATPIYSLHHARSGSDTLTASAYPVSDRPYHSHRPLFWQMLVLIFMSFRGPLRPEMTRYGLHARQVAYATLYTRGSDDFVSSVAALIATGWSEPAPGRDFHPLWTSAFSRRTE